MALYSFSPYSGPHGSSSAANTYFLPPTKGDFVAQLMTEESSDKKRITTGDGTYLGAGSGAPYPSGGQITCQFFMSTAWLKANGNTNYGAASANSLNNARKDFSQWVQMGGVGVLVDRWWTGTAWTQKTCTARIEGQPKWTWAVANSMLTIDVTLFCPRGMWTEADGATLTYFG